MVLNHFPWQVGPVIKISRTCKEYNTAIPALQNLNTGTQGELKADQIVRAMDAFLREFIHSLWQAVFVRVEGKSATTECALALSKTKLEMK